MNSYNDIPYLVLPYILLWRSYVLTYLLTTLNTHSLNIVWACLILRQVVLVICGWFEAASWPVALLALLWIWLGLLHLLFVWVPAAIPILAWRSLFANESGGVSLCLVGSTGDVSIGQVGATFAIKIILAWATSWEIHRNWMPVTWWLVNRLVLDTSLRLSGQSHRLILAQLPSLISKASECLLVLSIELLFLTDVLDKLVLFLLLPHIVLVQSESTLLGTRCNDLWEDAAPEHTKSSYDGDQPWSVLKVACAVVDSGGYERFFLWSVTVLYKVVIARRCLLLYKSLDMVILVSGYEWLYIVKCTYQVSLCHLLGVACHA